MRTSKQGILVFLITTLSSLCSAILSGYETYDKDISEHREFGCNWYGGSSSRMSCICREEAEMLIEKNTIPSYSTTEIEISGCKIVKFGKNSVTEIGTLRSIKLTNISSIIFDEESIIWYGYRDTGNQYEERFDLSVPSLKVAVRNSNITLISSHAFRGRINEIIFENVLVEKISPVAFANLLQTEKISIKNSVLRSMDQPFKKFSTENLEFDGVIAELISSRTFSNITVYQKFLINNCTFGTVRSGAFSINNPEIFNVMNSNIDHLNGEAFKVISSGNVLFQNNIFKVVDDGAFRGITLNKDEGLSNAVLTFDSNTFSRLTRDSLSISEDFSAKFINIYMNETCDCKNIDHNIKDTVYYTDIKCLYEGEYVTVNDFKSNMCSVISNHYITIIIACIVTTLVVVIISGLLLYYRFVYRSKKYGNEKESKKGNLSLIVPDGRTYRETELHVIVEKTDLLTTDL